MPNRLAGEPSPYLRQHASNPVDWYPWGEEAFEKARREEKPVFLSIGYSTCHWCHVMAHESFESREIADALNRTFVAIKVDREERPDVDRVYMAFVQATTGSGGWPMSVWLTSDLKPFFGGTYFPPSSRWGNPGFVDVLKEIERLWREERDKIVRSADTAVERLKVAHEQTRGGSAASAEPIAGAEALRQGVEQFALSFDRRNGGFGGAPKFPRPSELFFLLREHARAVGQAGPAASASPASPTTPANPANSTGRDMALQTLRAMALSGMRDHLGGGFHRYSVDAEWRVPHFEKMLYDQAQLAMAYVEAAQVSGDRFFAAVAEDTLAFVRREMTDPAGGFHSAEDADSVPPEHAGDTDAHTSEGAFYIWRDAEIAALFAEEADVVRFRFGIERHGNAPHDPHGEFTHKNLLYIAHDIEDVARLTGRQAGEGTEILGILDRARGVLFEVRSRRPRPHRDDKILAAWNGLMIAAFARAARVLGAAPRNDLEAVRRSGLRGREPGLETAAGDDGARTAAWLESARAAATFVRSTLWDDQRRVLLRRYRGGRAAIDGYSEDYAFVVWGLLELFQADADPVWLEWALRLQARQDELFWDAAEGGWFNTTGQDPSVLLRLKEDYDGAEPSASSVAVMNLLTFSHLTGDAGAAEKVERTLRRFGSRLGQTSRAVPMMMSALSTYHAGMRQLVIIGHPDAEDTRAMRVALSELYLPFAVTLVVEPGAHQARLAKALPFVEPMTMRDGRATAYVCLNFTCQEPVTTADGLRAALQST